MILQTPKGVSTTSVVQIIYNDGPKVQQTCNPICIQIHQNLVSHDFSKITNHPLHNAPKPIECDGVSLAHYVPLVMRVFGGQIWL